MKNKIAVFMVKLFASQFSFISAQADTLTTRSKINFISYTLSCEQGEMHGKGTGPDNPLTESVNYKGMELLLGFSKNKNSDIYNRLYNYPVTGIGWYISTFQQEAFGNPNALFYFFKIPLYPEKYRKLTLLFFSGIGVSYNFNSYDSATNSKNIYIGSKLNSYNNFGLLVNYRFKPKWIANISIGFKHFSNGSVKLPNLGINLVPVSVGITHIPRGVIVHDKEMKIPRFIKNNQINFAFSAALKNYEIAGPSYLKMVLGINWLRMFNYKFRAGIGIDIFYSSIPEGVNFISSTFSTPMLYGLVASGEWVLNKHLYFPFGLGVYLNQIGKSNAKVLYYERVGIRYRLNNKLFTGVTIKAHKDIADIFEWTVGYTIHHDPNKY